MSHILAIMNKEFKRFFTDKRLIFTIIAPGIAIFIIYSFLGSTISQSNRDNNATQDDNFKIVYSHEIPKLDSSDLFLFKGKYAKTKVDMTDEKLIFAALENNEIHLYLRFNDDFDNKIFDNNSDAAKIADVEIFYNSRNSNSLKLYNLYSKALESIVLKNNLTINVRSNIKYDYAVSSMLKDFMISFIPLILGIFLFSSAFIVCIESIVGEKERGTIASLLSTPAKRRDIALGKIFASGIISLIATFFTATGTLLSLPKLIGLDLSLNIFSFTTYLLLFIVLIIATIIYVITISILSSFAKSLKEANAYGSFLMILILSLGFSSMFGLSNNSFILYLIPFMNINQLINSILNSNLTVLNFLIGIGSNFGYIFLGVFLLTRMFNSEKIMFSINK